MFVLIVPGALATAAAWLLGGSPRGLARPIAWWPLGLGALLAELALSMSPLAHHPWLLASGHWLWTASLASVLVVLARNALRTGRAERAAWTIAAGGVALNLAVVFANGGYMPVSHEAL